MPTVVLDIDQTIVDHFGDMDLCQIKHQYSHYVDEFLKRGLLVRIIGAWHLIFPGVVEFIRWLDNQGIHIAFFSAAISERNHPLVIEILKRAFGESAYTEKSRSISVFSRNNLTADRRKDLIRAVPRGQQLEDAVIIDDQPDRIKNGQKKQLIPVKSTYHAHFERLHASPDAPAGLEVNQLSYVTALIAAAMKHAEVHKCTLSLALNAVREEETSIDVLLNEGQRLLQQVNPSFVLAKPGQLFATDYCPPIPVDYHEKMILGGMLSDETMNRSMLLFFENIERRSYTVADEAIHRRALTEYSRRLGLPFDVILDGDDSSFDSISDFALDYTCRR